MPRLSQFSIGPSERTLSIEVNPLVPMTIGEAIVVRVTDQQNGTPVDEALISVQKDGLDFNVTTKPDGTAIFEYPGATTVISVSKDGYSNPTPVVIPKIPDEWVSVRNYQYATWLVMLLATAIPLVFATLQERRQRNKPGRKNEKSRKGGKKLRV